MGRSTRRVIEKFEAPSRREAIWTRRHEARSGTVFFARRRRWGLPGHVIDFDWGSSSMRTLIIEDQASTAARLRDSVEALGHPVVGMTGSFATAVDWLLTLRDVDLAFIDLAMGDDAEAPRAGAPATVGA